MTDTPTKTPQTQTQTQTQTTAPAAVEAVTCDACGFTEECTAPYIRRVRDRHKGKWLCGLCAEAVKDEVVRSPTRISMEEALRRHSTFCHSFRSRSPEAEGGSGGGDHPISVIGRILRRSLGGSLRTAVRASSSGDLPGIDEANSPPRQSLLRSGSCFPSLST